MLKKPLNKLWNRIFGVFLWVKFRTAHKYHIVKIKSLEPGWHDTDERILHVCFDLLVEFVEKEWKVFELKEFTDKILVHVEDTSEITYVNYNKIWDLYFWWKHIRPYRNLDNISKKKWVQMRGNWDMEDDKYLKELIEIRGYLWT